MLAIIMSNVQYIIYMLTIIIGKNKYCFVSDGICCTLPSPSVSFLRLLLKRTHLKSVTSSQQVVNFYSASGAIGDLYDLFAAN